MGRKSRSGGITAKGDRIQFDITVGAGANRKRYRPTINETPTEANLRRARKRAEGIGRRIANGTFNFAEEFPDYKFIDDVADKTESPTFRAVAMQYLKSIRSEVEFATFESYRKILGMPKAALEKDADPSAEWKRQGFWIPRIGDKPITDIKYSDLTDELGDYAFGKRKTRNNIVSVVREVFAFAKKDRIIATSPADELKTLRVQKQPPDPYRVEEAEAIIAGIRKDWGEGEANYVELVFFSGMRPSEAIALQWPDIDRMRWTGVVNKARVMARDKDTTKTAVAREVEFCPRAIAVLERQWSRTGLAGKHVFGQDDGSPYHDIQVRWKRWQYTHKRLGLRYREPYQMRHTSVTWNLMIGKNLLWVAEQHGHSAAVMLKTYAKWLKGTTEEDIAAIKRAMGIDNVDKKRGSAAPM